MAHAAFDIVVNDVSEDQIRVQTIHGACSSDTGFVFNGSPTYYGSFRNKAPATVNTRPWVHHWKPPAPWSRLVYRFHVPTFVMTSQDPTGLAPCPPIGNISRTRIRGYKSGVISPPTNGEDPVDPVVVSTANNRVLNSLKSDGEAQLGLALLERKQTETLLINSVRRVVRTVQNFTTSLRRRDLSAFREAIARDVQSRRSGRTISQREAFLGRIPESWLEVQYGWKPLMSDVLSSMEAVDFAQQNDLYHFSKKKTSKRTRTERIDVQLSGVPGSNGYTGFRWRFDVLRTDLCTFRLDYTVDTGYLSTLSALGLLNPVSLAWERLPLSFVFDWFLPLGSWFNTFDAAAGKTFKGGSKTTVTYKPLTIGSPVQLNTPPPGTSVYKGFVIEPLYDRAYYSKLTMNREVLASFPSPVPPVWKNPFSPTHVANALSLLATTLGRGRASGIRL